MRVTNEGASVSQTSDVDNMMPAITLDGVVFSVHKTKLGSQHTKKDTREPIDSRGVEISYPILNRINFDSTSGWVMLGELVSRKL